MCKQKLEEFFNHYKKEISLNSLISMFKLNNKEIDLVINYLYELELEGKILKLENGNYIHISENYYLVKGELKKSSKNKFYVNLKHGKIITIPIKNLNGSKEGDVVFLEIEKGKKHSKQIIGKVKRIVERSVLGETNTFYKAKLKKDFLKNYYYVTLDTKLIYIATQDLNGAFVNDYVTIQLIDNNYAKVVNVVKRDSNSHVFEYKKVNGVLNWVPLNSNFDGIPKALSCKTTFKENDRILATILDDNTLDVIKVLDNNNSLRSIVEALLYDFGFRVDFNSSVLEELENINLEIPLEEINKRVDLRDLVTITIDGARAKDLDDAISLKELPDKYILYVHIADVSHYVKLNSKLLEEAVKRGTSIYPANYVIPQFPPLISNIVCSLNQDEDKLTKTFEIHLDKSGNLIDYRVYKSIIRSNKRMTYGKFNEILDDSVIYNDYLEYISLLKGMNNLSKILIQNRIDRGQINLEEQELEFDFDENDNVTQIKKRKRGQAELLIESFMLIANEVAAEFMHNLEVPFIYRNHEGPNIDQISKLKSEFKEISKYFNNLKNVRNSGMLQKVLLTMLDDLSLEEREYISKKIFNCMNRAYFSSINIGHYALALETYATFTSPIRRGPDLINHIILDYILEGKMEEINTYFTDIESLAQHFSEAQKKAEKFEKHVEGIVLNRVLSNYIDEELEATILFISSSNIFVKTSNNLYGSIPIKSKMYDLNCVHMDGREYRVKDSILIRIDHIDEKNNEIIFRQVKVDNKTLSLVKRG